MDRRYSSEIWRLQTFLTFPHDALSSTIVLARQGFVYIGKDSSGEDLVQCVFCLSLSVICNRDGTNIRQFHIRLNASCPIVRGIDCDNVLIGQSDEPLFTYYRERPYHSWLRDNQLVGQDLNFENVPPQSFTPAVPFITVPRQDLILYGQSSQPDTGGRNLIRWRRGASLQATDVDATSELVTSQTQSSAFLSDPSVGNVRRFGEQRNPNPAMNQRSQAGASAMTDNFLIRREINQHEFYADEKNRLASFAPWPFGHHLKPEDLAKAGFFYEGCPDCVRCFHCGIGFRSWDSSFDPWVAHVKYRPHCAFLQVTLGKAFVNVAMSRMRDRSGYEMVLYEDIIAEMKARGLDRDIPEGVQFTVGPRQAMGAANTSEDDDMATSEKSKLEADRSVL